RVRPKGPSEESLSYPLTELNTPTRPNNRILAVLLLILLGVGVIEAGIGVWQFQFRGHGPDGFQILGNHWRAYGTLEQPNPFGGLLGLLWPLAAMIALYFGFDLARRFILPRFVPLLKRFWIKSQPTPAVQPWHSALAFSLLASAAALLTLGALFLSFSRGA